MVAKVTGFSRPQDLVFNPNNIPSARIYVADNDFVRIINPVNNALIKSLGGFHYAWGVKMHPTARQCYVGSVGPGGDDELSRFAVRYRYRDGNSH